MSYSAFIQARMASTRLPSKVMLELKGKTVLEHVINRVSRAEGVDSVYVLTTTNPKDVPIRRFCERIDMPVYCGSEDDVLDRYYRCAQLAKPGNIIRITSDCPLIDPEVIGLLVGRHMTDSADYTSNVQNTTFPDGQDVEVFTLAALEKAWREAELTSEREHVTPYIRNHPELFRLVNVVADTDLSHMRWTLDTEEDMQFISKLYDGLYDKNPFFGMKETIEHLEQHPDLSLLNGSIRRNEGYEQSLREDAASEDRND